MTFNDSGILGLIILFFLASATFIPIAQSAFDNNITTVNGTTYADNIVDSGHDLSLSPLSFFGVFANVFKLAFVGVSGIPWYIDMIYSFLAVIFVMLLAKYIPTIGSGG